MEKESKNSKIEINRFYDIDKVHIGYNPSTQTARGKTPKSLTLELHTTEGWIRLRMKDDICELFDRIYHQQTDGRPK